MSFIQKAYSMALKRSPLLVQSFQAGCLMGAGDVISQFVVENKTLKTYEWIRSARFFCIGTFFVGPTLKTWYGLLDRHIGPSGSKATAIKKTVVDQLLMAPSFISVLISLISFTQGNSIVQTKQQFEANYVDIVLNNWKVWPVVQLTNFYFIPLQHQVLVVQVFALFWNTYMAWKTNQTINLPQISSPDDQNNADGLPKVN